MKKLYKLDIGCGQNKQKGFIGIDIAKAPGVDIVWDLNKYPWPIKSNSVDEAFSSHYLEHIPHDIKGYPNKDGLFLFMDELYRVMKKGAKATHITPWWNSVRGWQDPTHRRLISDATYQYFRKDWREANKLDHYNVKCNFDFAPGYAIIPPWNVKSEESRQFAINHYVNVVSDLYMTITKM